MTVHHHTASYICSHIFDASRPVLLVVHEDGDWSLMCGDGHDFDRNPPKVVGIGHILDRDPSLSQVLDLENGFEAERRGVNEPWERRPISAV
jgi:hypothetical protein